MNPQAWQEFSSLRESFRKTVGEILRRLPDLPRWQEELVKNRSGPVYRIETPVVYNTALDEVTADDEIKLILVADNPGRREQAAETQRYLAGPSGKIAARFFREHPELKIDFNKNVIILNKTPIHTPRTNELSDLCRLGGCVMEEAMIDSQTAMAELLFSFYNCFSSAQIWITGYSEMKKGGLFETYTQGVRKLIKCNHAFNKKLFVFRHFSMNQFTIDLNKQRLPDETCTKALNRIGSAYRERILG